MTAAKTDDRSPANIRAQLDAAKTPLAKLRVPFAENQIGKLPRNIKKNDPDKFSCTPGPNLHKASKDGVACGGYHAWSIHLDFVGHAAITDRLLEVDEKWDWEPLTYTEDGLPKFDQFGGLWIKLTVAGITRLGYGDAQGKPAGPTAQKEVIGDALRNAGMRFGMALDLWHKGDLHDFAEEQGVTTSPEALKDAPTAPRTRAKAAPKEVEAPVEPGTDPNLQAWVDNANAADTADDVLQIWREAKGSFGRTATVEQKETLNKIAKVGESKRAAEDAAINAKLQAEQEATSTVANGFGGQLGQPHE